MAQTFRIKFNPQTKEIEVDGTEAFVKKYFAILSGQFPSESAKPADKKRGPKKAAAPKTKPAKAKAPEAKAAKAKAPKASMTGSIIALVQKSQAGISIENIVKKIKASKSMVAFTLSKAKKEGKIASIERGVYGPA